MYLCLPANLFIAKLLSCTKVSLHLCIQPPQGFCGNACFFLMCSFNCVPSLLLIGVSIGKIFTLFFVRALFHCFVCALVAAPRIGRTLVVSFDILRRLRLVTALSLRSYKTNVSGCGGGLIAFLPIIKRLIPLTESHLVGVIIFNSIQLSLVSDIDMYQRHLIPDYQEVSPINRVTPGLIIFRLLIL